MFLSVSCRAWQVTEALWFMPGHRLFSVKGKRSLGFNSIALSSCGRSARFLTLIWKCLEQEFDVSRKKWWLPHSWGFGLFGGLLPATLVTTRQTDLASCFHFSSFHLLPSWEESMISSIKPSRSRRLHLLQTSSTPTVNTCSQTHFQGSAVFSPSCLSVKEGMFYHCQLLLTYLSVPQLRQIASNISLLVDPSNQLKNVNSLSLSKT